MAASLLPLLSISAAGPAYPQAIGEIGVGLTPAHFPRHSDDDIEKMYAKAKALGQMAVLNLSWNGTNTGQVSEAMLLLARQHGLIPVVELDILEQGGFQPAPPSGVQSSPTFTPQLADAYATTVSRLAKQRPDYLAVATDINRLLAGGMERYMQFAGVYKRIYKLAKDLSPQTKVFVIFNWDIFANAARENHVPVADLHKLVDVFRPEIDVLAMASSPSERFAKPSDVPPDYYQAIAEFRAGEPLLLQVGWPGSSGGEAAQAAFVDRLPKLVGSLSPAMLIWPILHDLKSGPPQVASLGLYRASGESKPAAEHFHALPHNIVADASPKQAADEAVVISPVVEPVRRDRSDRFAIYTSTLAGAAPTLLASDPHREINHARVSPDHSRFVFTRYNQLNNEGVAEETTSPWETEVVVCAIDGNDCQSIVPPRPGIAAGNAYWTPDGKRLVYFTNDRPSHKPGINILDLETHAARPFVVSDQIYLADPHLRGGKTVMAGTARSGVKVSKLYLTDSAGEGLKKLTEPAIPDLRSLDPPLGDVDPKLSPDGRHVAFMRHLSKDDWGVFVVDVATGIEKNLSGPNPVDAVPEWSSDGALLIFWHVERSDARKTGLYTMRPDGGDRRQVPLPTGFFYTMPAFFPGSGSGPDSKIIYSARPIPRPH